MDEAIVEFQRAAQDDSRLLECASMLGICFIEKGMLKVAVEWLETGLQAPGRTEEEYQALRYDLANALELAGERERALAIFTKLYGQSSARRPSQRRQPAPLESFADHERWRGPLGESLRRVEDALKVLGSRLIDRELDEVLATLDRCHRVIEEDHRAEFRICVLRLQRAARILEDAIDRE